jgi:hypothetical protein
MPPEQMNEPNEAAEFRLRRRRTARRSGTRMASAREADGHASRTRQLGCLRALRTRLLAQAGRAEGVHAI